jgi:5-methylcytosine-specific restriction protein A
VRDHIVPLWAGGLDVETNTQALCDACHDAKTAAESRWRYHR